MACQTLQYSLFHLCSILLFIFNIFLFICTNFAFIFDNVLFICIHFSFIFNILLFLCNNSLLLVFYIYLFTCNIVSFMFFKKSSSFNKCRFHLYAIIAFWDRIMLEVKLCTDVSYWTYLRLRHYFTIQYIQWEAAIQSLTSDVNEYP